MEAIGKLLEHLGFAAPLLYAGAAYGFFYWLDENLSDAAKAALASTMRLKNYGKEQVASALVEVFDRIYTRPLLGWRAFVRSLLFTTVVSAIFVFEQTPSAIHLSILFLRAVTALSFNVFTDYLSLFVIRPLLIRSGTKAVVGLILAAMSGAAIVLLANALRTAALSALVLSYAPNVSYIYALKIAVLEMLYYPNTMLPLYRTSLWYMVPAIVVFAWLPLLALGIVAIRALTPLSWIVEKAQWALKEGDKHPLKAIGCVAAVAVLAVTVGLRAIFAA